MERDRCIMGAGGAERQPLPVRSPVGAPISVRSTTDTREILRNVPSLMGISREKVSPESPNPSIGSVQVGLCGGSAPHEPLVHSVVGFNRNRPANAVLGLLSIDKTLKNSRQNTFYPRDIGLLRLFLLLFNPTVYQSQNHTPIPGRATRNEACCQHGVDLTTVVFFFISGIIWCRKHNNSHDFMVSNAAGE